MQRTEFRGQSKDKDSHNRWIGPCKHRTTHTGAWINRTEVEIVIAEGNDSLILSSNSTTLVIVQSDIVLVTTRGFPKTKRLEQVIYNGISWTRNRAASRYKQTCKRVVRMYTYQVTIQTLQLAGTAGATKAHYRVSKVIWKHKRRYMMLGIAVLSPKPSTLQHSFAQRLSRNMLSSSS